MDVDGIMEGITEMAERVVSASLTSARRLSWLDLVKMLIYACKSGEICVLKLIVPYLRNLEFFGQTLIFLE
jgi:hypothetical protein